MLRGLTGLAMLGSAAAIAAGITVGGFGPGVTEAMDAESVANNSYELASAPADADASPSNPAAAPIPSAAVVDAALLSPYPMVVASATPVRTISYPAPAEAVSAPVQADKDVTGSIRPQAAEKPAPAAHRLPPATTVAPAAAAPTPVAAAKKPVIAPRLERDGTLNVAQIAHIKAALNLSPDQEQYWLPVEAELREIARQLAAQKAAGRKPSLALGANEAQRLYWAAGPLIMSLREDQKREVRRLARAMGLEQVASLI